MSKIKLAKPTLLKISILAILSRWSMKWIGVDSLKEGNRISKKNLTISNNYV